MATGDDQAGIAALIVQLAENARDVGKAELALAKARASAAVTRYRTVAIFFASAGVLALCGLIAMLVGLILTLTPRIGPGFATLAVVGVTMLLAGVLGYLGRSALTARIGA